MINVLYCCDSLAYEGLKASITSLLMHTKNVNIFVFTMDYIREEEYGTHYYIGLNEGWRNDLKKLVHYFDPKGSHICFYDLSETYKEYFLHGVNEDDGHSSPYAPLRLVVDLVIPEINDVLYIDCDTLIFEDLTPMYFDYLQQIKNSTMTFAGYNTKVRKVDEQGKELPLDEDEDVGYELVAGVLLFDLQKNRETKLLEKARYNITHKKYRWYDQTALDDACHNHFVRLDERYNFMHDFCEEDEIKPAIMHFSNDLEVKIFPSKKQFYRKYPQFRYIDDKIKLIDSLNIKY